MKLEIRFVDAPLGHHILNADLSRLDDATFTAIEDAFNRYGVIVIENQTLSPEAQLAFTRRLGKEVRYPLDAFQLRGFPDIFVVSNVIEDGKPIGMADAGRLWHTDMIFTEAPPRCSVLYALEVPHCDGEPLGDTLFASTAAAYDALPETTRRRIEGLKAINSYRRYAERRHREEAASRPETTAQAVRDKNQDAHPDIVHPLVRSHPITGRRCLYVSDGTTVEIVGWNQADSDALIAELLAHMTRPEFVYRHRWKVGDVVMWDNCSAIHQALGDYELPARRRMHRTTIEGTRPS
jgi:taurine dioxygenase